MEGTLLKMENLIMSGDQDAAFAVIEPAVITEEHVLKYLEHAKKFWSRTCDAMQKDWTLAKKDVKDAEQEVQKAEQALTEKQKIFTKMGQSIVLFGAHCKRYKENKAHEDKDDQ